MRFQTHAFQITSGNRIFLPFVEHLSEPFIIVGVQQGFFQLGLIFFRKFDSVFVQFFDLFVKFGLILLCFFQTGFLLAFRRHPCFGSRSMKLHFAINVIAVIIRIDAIKGNCHHFMGRFVFKAAACAQTKCRRQY